MACVLPLAAVPLRNKGVDFRGFFENFPDPVVYLGADLKIEERNKEFRARFPKAAGDLFQAPIQALLEKSSPDGEPHRLPVMEPHALEPQVTWLAEGGALVVLRPPAAKAEKDSGEENRAHLIHELRTPLNAILGFSDMMQQEIFGPLGDDHYKRYAQIIHESGGRLLGLVNDLMDLSKLDAGKMDLHVRQFEVLRVIMESVREVETLAAKSRICIVMHVFDGVSTLVADDKRVHQMMLNMLSNAIKFTPERGEIDIDIYRRGSDIVIAVSDTGVGMRESDIPTALEPFGQLDNQGSSAGTGLGLPLTKQFAELHGGTLELESTLGGGTTIRVVLPELGKDAEAPSLSKTAAH